MKLDIENLLDNIKSDGDVVVEHDDLMDTFSILYEYSGKTMTFNEYVTDYLSKALSKEVTITHEGSHVTIS